MPPATSAATSQPLTIPPLTRPGLRDLREFIERNKNHPHTLYQKYRQVLVKLGDSYLQGRLTGQEYAYCLSELFVLKAQYLSLLEKALDLEGLHEREREQYKTARALLENIWQHFNSRRATYEVNQYVDRLYDNTYIKFRNRSMRFIEIAEQLKTALFTELNFYNGNDADWSYFIHHFIIETENIKNRSNEAKKTELYKIIARSLFWIKTLDEEVATAIANKSENPDIPAQAVQVVGPVILDRNYVEVCLGIYALLSSDYMGKNANQLLFANKFYVLADHEEFPVRRKEIENRQRKIFINLFLILSTLSCALGAFIYLIIWAKELNEKLTPINSDVNSQNEKITSLCYNYNGIWAAEHESGSAACDVYDDAINAMRDCCNGIIACVQKYRLERNDFEQMCQQYDVFKVNTNIDYHAVSRTGMAFSILFGFAFSINIPAIFFLSFFIYRDFKNLFQKFFEKLQTYLNQYQGAPEHVYRDVTSYDPSERINARMEIEQILQSSLAHFIAAPIPQAQVAIDVGIGQVGVEEGQPLLAPAPAQRSSLCAVM